MVAALQLDVCPIATLWIGLYACHSDIILSFRLSPKNPSPSISSLEEVKSTVTVAPDVLSEHLLRLDWLLLNV